MRGDALASGARSATFTATDDKNMGQKFDEAVSNLTPAKKPVFGLCNAKECAELEFFSAEEFVEHVHTAHA